MAALFTPESERARKSQSDRGSNAGPAAAGFRVPGAERLSENARSGDSLGNPASPGYEPPPAKPKNAPQQELTDQSVRAHGETFAAPSYGPETIRLEAGYEQLLLAQGKLCEKATTVFTRLDGPVRYRRQRKGRLLDGKSRGCIVDVDAEESVAAPPKTDDDAA